MSERTILLALLGLSGLGNLFQYFVLSFYKGYFDQKQRNLRATRKEFNP